MATRHAWGICLLLTGHLSGARVPLHWACCCTWYCSWPSAIPVASQQVNDVKSHVGPRPPSCRAALTRDLRGGQGARGLCEPQGCLGHSTPSCSASCERSSSDRASRQQTNLRRATACSMFALHAATSGYFPGACVLMGLHACFTTYGCMHVCIALHTKKVGRLPPPMILCTYLLRLSCMFTPTNLLMFAQKTFCLRSYPWTCGCMRFYGGFD